MKKMDEQIKELRLQIDQIDREIIERIARRLTVAKRLGESKKSQKLPITDLVREKELRRLHEKVCSEFQLDYLDIEAVFGHLIALSKKVQRKI